MIDAQQGEHKMQRGAKRTRSFATESTVQCPLTYLLPLSTSYFFGCGSLSLLPNTKSDRWQLTGRNTLLTRQCIMAKNALFLCFFLESLNAHRLLLLLRQMHEASPNCLKNHKMEPIKSRSCEKKSTFFTQKNCLSESWRWTNLLGTEWTVHYHRVQARNYAAFKAGSETICSLSLCEREVIALSFSYM